MCEKNWKEQCHIKTYIAINLTKWYCSKIYIKLVITTKNFLTFVMPLNGAAIISYRLARGRPFYSNDVILLHQVMVPLHRVTVPLFGLHRIQSNDMTQNCISSETHNWYMYQTWEIEAITDTCTKHEILKPLLIHVPNMRDWNHYWYMYQTWEIETITDTCTKHEILKPLLIHVPNMRDETITDTCTKHERLKPLLIHVPNMRDWNHYWYMYQTWEIETITDTCTKHERLKPLLIHVPNMRDWNQKSRVQTDGFPRRAKYFAYFATYVLFVEQHVASLPLYSGTIQWLVKAGLGDTLRNYTFCTNVTILSIGYLLIEDVTSLIKLTLWKVEKSMQHHLMPV